MWVGQRASEGMNSTRDPLHAYRLFTPFHPPQNELKSSSSRTPIRDPLLAYRSSTRGFRGAVPLSPERAIYNSLGQRPGGHQQPILSPEGA